MVFGQEYLKALKYLALGKRPKTDHPAGRDSAFPSRSPYFPWVSFSIFLLFLAVHGPLVSLAMLTEGTALAQDDSLIPGELALCLLHKELQLECQNTSFRMQYYYNHRLVLQEQIAKVLDKLNTHYYPLV
jgi:hypothetical protein